MLYRALLPFYDYLLRFVNCSLGFVNQTIYGGRFISDRAPLSFDRWYIFLGLDSSFTLEPSNVNLYYRLTNTWPFVSIGIKNYIVFSDVTQAHAMSQRCDDSIYHISVHGDRVSLKRSESSSSYFVGNGQDGSEIFDAQLVEINTGYTFDVTRVMQDLVGFTRCNQIQAYELFPLFFEVYSIRYSPPENLCLTIVLAETFDIISFKSFDVVKI